MTSLRQSCISERSSSQCQKFAKLFACLLLFVMSVVTTNLRAQVYTDMHDFNCQVDGCGVAYAGIVAQGRDGNLYSTKETGSGGGGTVYTITPSGAFNV